MNVVLNGLTSRSLHTNVRIPRGYNMEPMLFLIFIIYLPDAITYQLQMTLPFTPVARASPTDPTNLATALGKELQ